MKSSTHHIFEAGILTNAPALIVDASQQFGSVWRGEHCTRCDRRRKHCYHNIR